MRYPFVTATLLLCLCACGRSAEPSLDAKGPSPDEIQARLLRISEAALAAKETAAKATSGKTALAWETLATMLPDRVGKLSATGPATGHLDATTTFTSKAKRSYSTEAQSVKIDLMDVARAPNVLLAFMLQRGAVQSPAAANDNATGKHPAVQDGTTGDGTVNEATTVGAFPALTRLSHATQESIVTLALAHRFVVEVRVTPSTTATDATRIAAALPLADIEALAAKPTDDPSQP